MKNLTAYNLACGGVQREEINGHWVELYKESNCYHVRTGKIGAKWSEWESFDNGEKSPLKLARECYNEFKDEIKNLHEFLYIIDLNERGFFKAHVEDKNSSKTFFSFGNESEEELEDGISMIEDGYMKNVEDVDGLKYYLIECKIIPIDATLEFIG